MLNNDPSTNSLDAPALLQALLALKKGDFSVRLPENATGIAREIASAFNSVAALNEGLAKDLERVGDERKTDPPIARSKNAPAARGAWAKSFKLVSTMVMSHPGSKKASAPAPSGDRLNTSELLKTAVAWRKGDFAVRLPADWVG